MFLSPVVGLEIILEGSDFNKYHLYSPIDVPIFMYSTNFLKKDGDPQIMSVYWRFQ